MGRFNLFSFSLLLNLSRIDIVFVLCLCIIYGLNYNIVAYLWFSTLTVLVFFLRPHYGWFFLFVGFSVRFYFYLYGLESYWFYSALSKLFYSGLLMVSSVLRARSLFLFLRYLILLNRLFNYLLASRAYYFLLSLIRERILIFFACVAYLLSFHEFRMFALIIAFPLSFVFYLKANILLQRGFVIYVMFIIPIVLALQIRNFPLLEEVFITLRVLVFLSS